jgi:hypothetical protein
MAMLHSRAAVDRRIELGSFTHRNVTPPCAFVDPFTTIEP